MDFKQIQELIRIVNKSNIGEVSIEEKGFKLTIKQKQDNVQQIMAAPQLMPSYQQAVAAPVAPAQPGAAASPEKPKSGSEPVASNLITIKSPMIGTFYRRSAPEKPSFVEVGTEVAPGKVVCIIEAMKLFNEIESEVKGTIVKILVEDSSPVEYDQPLFMVEPT